MTETRIRVAALIVHEGKVLLVSTKRGKPGYLVPPGGGVEAGEGLAEAVVREVAEEAGLEVEAGAMVAWREFAQGHKRVLELYLVARLLGEAEEDAGEERRVVWVEVEGLGGVKHFPEQLGELCRLAAEGCGGAVWLGEAEVEG
ncbi:MAG: NUDIX domain-containing protein [Armatimonadia bacterium]